VVTMDLHASQIQGFFDIPFDHIYSSLILTQHLLDLNIPDLVVVAPTPAVRKWPGHMPSGWEAVWPWSTSVVPDPVKPKS